MSTDQSSFPSGDELPDVDLGQVERALASSRSVLGGDAPGFRLVREIGRSSDPPLKEPQTLVTTPDDCILVLDQIGPDEFRVLRFNADGRCEGVSVGIPRDEREGLVHPTGLGLSPEGELFVTDGDANAVVKFSHDGRWLEAFRTAGDNGSGFRNPRDVECGLHGTLYVVDSFNDRVVQFTAGRPELVLWSQFANPFTEELDDTLYEPTSVCVADDGTVYIADTNNQRVLAFRDQQLVAQWSGTGLFEFPTEVRLSRDQHSLLVADRGNLRVRRFHRGAGPQDGSGCLGTLSLVSASHSVSKAGGGDIDVLSSGAVTLVNSQRQSVAIVDFLDASR
jgi:DNA-binding beta-propeller fold protein YncE